MALKRQRNKFKPSIKTKSRTSRKDVMLQIWVRDRAGGGSKYFYCLGAFVNKNNNQSKNFYELLISV